MASRRRREGAVLVLVCGLFMTVAAQIAIVMYRQAEMEFGLEAFDRQTRQAYAAARAGLRRAKVLLNNVPPGVDLQTARFADPEPFSDGCTYEIAIEVPPPDRPTDPVRVTCTGTYSAGHGANVSVLGLFFPTGQGRYELRFWDRATLQE